MKDPEIIEGLCKNALPHVEKISKKEKPETSEEKILMPYYDSVKTIEETIESIENIPEEKRGETTKKVYEIVKAIKADPARSIVQALNDDEKKILTPTTLEDKCARYLSIYEKISKKEKASNEGEKKAMEENSKPEKVKTMIEIIECVPEDERGEKAKKLYELLKKMKGSAVSLAASFGLIALTSWLAIFA